MADAQTEGKEGLSFFERGLAAERAEKMQEAAMWYRCGWEEERDANAGVAWANCLFRGSGVTRDFAAAVCVAQALVEADCPLGYYFLGEAARTGKGAPLNTEKSADCFRRMTAATEEPVAGLDESLRCLYRTLVIGLNGAEAIPARVVPLVRRIAELNVLPNAHCLAVFFLSHLEEAAREPGWEAELKTLLHLAAEGGERMHPLAEVLTELAMLPESLPSGQGIELCLRLEKAVEHIETEASILSLLFRMWSAALPSDTELPADEAEVIRRRTAEILSRMMQKMRFGESGMEPQQPRGLDVYLMWPHGPLMSYAWVYQPDPLQDLAAVEQGYRSDVAAYLRVTNETNETLSHLHLRVCDIANGEEYETEVDDVELPAGEVADFSLCMRGLTYSESMYIEVTSGSHRAELDSEGIDMQAMLGYPEPTPAEVCWETGFWGTPVLRVFNPGTEPLRVSLTSEGGVPCWATKTVMPQEEVRFGWYDMMHLRMPAAEECAVFACIPLILYNGKKGLSLNKYFFYGFYPGHIFLLWLLRLIIR